MKITHALASFVLGALILAGCGDDDDAAPAGPCTLGQAASCAAGSACAETDAGNVCVPASCTPGDATTCDAGQTCALKADKSSYECVAAACSLDDASSCGDGLKCEQQDDNTLACVPKCDVSKPKECGVGKLCKAVGDGADCVPGCIIDDPETCQDGLLCEKVQGGDPLCFAPVYIQGKVFDAVDESDISKARIAARDEKGGVAGRVAESDTNGEYKLAMSATRNKDGSPLSTIYTLRCDAADYATFPSGLRPALPIDIGEATASDEKAPEGDNAGKVYMVQTPATDIAMLALPTTDGLGTIRGTVDADNPGGTLCVAGSSSGIADSTGEFVIFNVPAGSQEVHGYAADLQLSTESVQVPDGGEVKDVVLTPTNGELATVSGSVQLVNAGGFSSTTVVLVVEETYLSSIELGEVPRGLIADNVSGAFSISGVPDGKYVVLASLNNDGLVRDPDTSIGGTQIAHIEVTNGSDQSGLGFKVTEALAVISPGATAPEEVSGTPTFSWEDDSSEDHYEVTVFDAFGNIMWQDLNVPSVQGNNKPTVEYGGPVLTKGMYYQFRATSVKDGVAISRTEDLRGVFIAR